MKSDIERVLIGFFGLLVVGFIFACNVPWDKSTQLPQTTTNSIHPTPAVVPVDLTLSFTNSANIDLTEGGNKPGVLWRVVNKTNVEFVKGELMYLSGGVLEVFEPTRMEFTTKNMMVDTTIVNGMFILLTDQNGNTSTCVIHGFDGNTAQMSCTGFSAPSPAKP